MAQTDTIASAHTIPLLDRGFRPFFFGAGLWAALAILMWSATLGHGLQLPTAFAPVTWHAHAMLFGFLGAALAGFLTTAVPNWTGRPALRGAPLAALAGLWGLGRVACLTSGIVGAVPAAVVDVGFFVALGVIVLREVLAAGNRRNLLVVVGISGVALANLLVHLGPIAGVDRGYGIRLGVGMFALLIVLIGGRIVPVFTRNWLQSHGSPRLPAMWGRYDSLTALATVVAVLAWTLLPDTRVTGGVMFGVGLLNAGRVARWCAWQAWREPLILVLHLGYAWLAAGFLLLGLQMLVPGLLGTSAVHALTAGAMGTMVLAVMTRATRGHTGRALSADVPTVLLFVALTLAVLLRLAAPLVPQLFLVLLGAAALAWAAAFGGFVLFYAPMLFGSGKS
ncbi:NnrS family protein [Rhodovibrio salinarum]|uniref:NnrS family protein n=1 Tax=Rhodovibrio salinarum TaxID=1087 RepID=A0A934QGI2_9PROT|nr:NnrS family protein [Rhodovibrio salinarum]MBK1696571.1 NnrS family protein [Rhodovibrio salinarum]